MSIYDLIPFKRKNFEKDLSPKVEEPELFLTEEELSILKKVEQIIYEGTYDTSTGYVSGLRIFPYQNKYNFLHDEHYILTIDGNRRSLIQRVLDKYNYRLEKERENIRRRITEDFLAKEIK